MLRKRKPSRNTDSLKNVGLLREVHMAMQIQAIQDGQTMQEAVNIVLCQHLGRLDLIEKILEPAQAR